jgi:hypothetical protein
MYSITAFPADTLKMFTPQPSRRLEEQLVAA